MALAFSIPKEDSFATSFDNSEARLIVLEREREEAERIEAEAANKQQVLDAIEKNRPKTVAEVISEASRIIALNDVVPPTPVRKLVKDHPRPVKAKSVYTPISYAPVPAKLDGFSTEELAEYVELANTVGVSPQDLKVAELKAYLRSTDITVFDLKTVIKFMDEKSMKEGNGWGWHWVPLRSKDRLRATFGQEATRREFTWEGETDHNQPASDYYTNFTQTRFSVQETSHYDKVVPLHALKKVAKIEKEFKHQVYFVVSDYVPAPAFKADPFLMVMIPNAGLAGGEGRFVIDVWDEPSFGIEHMVKSGI